MLSSGLGSVFGRCAGGHTKMIRVIAQSEERSMTVLIRPSAFCRLRSSWASDRRVSYRLVSWTTAPGFPAPGPWPVPPWPLPVPGTPHPRAVCSRDSAQPRRRLQQQAQFRSRLERCRLSWSPPSTICDGGKLGTWPQSGCDHHHNNSDFFSAISWPGIW